MYKQWKSLEEEMPALMCGILIKIESKNEADAQYHDTINKLYYGYMISEHTCMLTAIIEDMHVDTMGWRVTKEFDLNEIKWLYDMELSQSWKK